jgi:tetratricopeptide (TPR) repeat protein
MTCAHFRARTLIGLSLLCSVVPGFAAAAASPADQSQPEYSRPQEGEDSQIAVRGAQTQVAEARNHAADNPEALADALTTLGDALLAARDYASAQAAYSEALQIAEQHDDPNDARTFGPQRGLGYVLAAMGRHDEAVPYLERALPVARSKYGVVDAEQIELLQALSNNLTALGRPDEARKHMYYTLRLAEKTYGESDPRVAPAICALGNWFTEVFQPAYARSLHRAALNIVTRSVGADDLAAVEPLRGFARIDMQVVSYPELALRAKGMKGTFAVDAQGHRLSGSRKVSDEGEAALKRALGILEAHGQDAPKSELVDTLIQLGDWYQIKRSPRQAMPYYQRAWTLMTLDSSSQPATHPFSFPVRVFYPTPNIVAPRPASGTETRDAQFVEVQFNVDANGRVSAPRIVDHNTSQRYADQVLSAVRDARYRPRFVDGQPVATAAVSVREVLSINTSPEPAG